MSFYVASSKTIEWLWSNKSRFRAFLRKAIGSFVALTSPLFWCLHKYDCVALGQSFGSGQTENIYAILTLCSSLLGVSRAFRVNLRVDYTCGVLDFTFHHETSYGILVTI